MKNTVIAFLAATIGALATIPAQAAETIKFGFSAEPYPPFFNKDSAGTWTGFEVDLKNAICKQLHATCVIVPITWDGLIPALNEKKIDVIWSSMSITDERRQVVDFTNKYYNTPSIMIGAKTDQTKIGIIANPDGKGGQILDGTNLHGKVLGVQTSSTQGNYVAKYFGAAVQMKEYDTLDNTLADLLAGRIDYVFADQIALDTFLRSDRGQDIALKAVLPDDTLLGEGVGGAVRKGDEALRQRLNTAIAALRQNGDYDRMAKKYFSFDVYGN